MQDAGYAALQIIPSFEGFQGHLERGSSGALIAAGTSGGRKYGDAAGRSMATAFTAHARRAAFLAAGGLALAGAAVIKLGRGSLAEAREAQKVGALTTQVIKSTGGAANVTAREVGNLSEKLSMKTGVDDEVIQRGANMLLTFKNVRNEVGKNNDIFSQSVAITEDMAASMAGGQGGNQLDLKSSSILVGKALNDPIKGVTALTRVGVTFTEQQKKNIETLVEQNKQSAAQKVVLKELKSEFGGAAAAQATLGEKVSVAWGNIQEKLGTAILPLVHDVQRAILRDGLPAAERFSDWFQHDGVPKIRNFINEARPLANEVLPAVATVFGDVRDIAHDALPYVKDVIGAFNDMPDWATKGLAIGGLGALAGKKLGAGSLITGGGTSGGLLGGITATKPLPVYVVNKSPIGDPGGGGRGGYGKYLALAAAEVAVAVGGTKLAVDSQGANGVPGVNSGGSGQAVTPGHGINAFPDVGPKTPFWEWGPFGPDKAPDWVGSATDEINAATKAMIAGVGKYGTAVDGLPKQLVTKFLAPGLVQNREDVVDMVKKFDLTPKQKATLFRVLGIPQVKRDTNDVLDLYRQANRTVTGDVHVNTASAEAGLNRVLSLMLAVNKRGALQAQGAIPTPGGGSPRRVTPSRSGRRRPIPIQLDGRTVGKVFDEHLEADHDLAGERQRAGAHR